MIIPELALLYPSLLRRSALLLAPYPGHPLEPEDLLHAAIERLWRRPPAGGIREGTMAALVVSVMQRTLIDEWRKDNAMRRIPRPSARLEEAGNIAAPEADPWPDLTDALLGLRQALPKEAEVVDCRFFQGIPQSELARTLFLSPATVSRRWRTAAAWLREALGCSVPVA